MSSDDNNDDEQQLEVKAAAHETDKDPKLAQNEGDDDAVWQPEYRNEVVFERFAKDIYQSAEAGIREPLSNAITACVRAKELYDVDDPRINITLQHSSGEKYLLMKDEGIGMTADLIQEAILVIGNSTSRDDGDKAGKFGMGFLACYMLNDWFRMHTRARQDGADDVKGVWRPQAQFEPDDEDETPDILGDDEYGTALLWPLRDDISVRQVKRWVRKHAEWSRVPVEYEFVDNGDTADEATFGLKELEDRYDDDSPVLTVENEYFKACASPDANGEIIMLDSPINGSPGRMRGIPSSWDVDVRLKNENGIIVDGPNEGLMAISDSEYKARPDGQLDSFIKESDEAEDDVQLPEPTGTRDTLGRSPDFWSYLNDQLEEQYKDEMQRILDKVSEIDDFLGLPSWEQDLFAEEIVQSSASKIRRRASSKFDYDIGSSLAQVLASASRGVKVIKHGANVNNLSYKDSKEIPIWKLLAETGDEGEVFMAVTLNQTKAKVVWADHDDNRIVELEGRDEYDEYDEFDWRKLKEIRSTTIDEFDVPDDVKKPFTSDGSVTGRDYANPNAGKDAPDRELTIHLKRKNNTRKLEVSDIDDEFVQAGKDGRDPAVEVGYSGEMTTLVLFPPDTDRNLSDCDWIPASNVGMANCTKMVYEYLSEHEGVYHVDNYADGIDGIELTTDKGTQTFESAVQQPDTGLVLHVVPESLKPWFTGDEDTGHSIMTNIADDLATANRYTSIRRKFGSTPSTITYAPVTTATVDRLRPKLLERNDVVVAKGNASYSPDSDITSKRLEGRDFALYARARLPEWHDTSEFDTMLDHTERGRMNSGTMEMLNLFTELHDDTETRRASETLDNPYETSEMAIYTSSGEMGVEEAAEADDKVVYHVVKPEVVTLFRDNDRMERSLQFLLDNAETGGYRSRSAFNSGADSDDYIYAPVTPTEMDSVTAILGSSDAHDDPTYVVGAVSDRWGDGSNVSNDARVYAYARFEDWESTGVFDKLTSTEKSLHDRSTMEFFESLGELHDDDKTPPQFNP